MTDGRVTRHDNRGFTLIELLVVVAVIGLLAAIAIPRLQRAMLRSRVTRMANDSTALHKAMVGYHVDHSNYPPTSTPAEEALDLRTLDPLVSKGYLRGSANVVGTLLGQQITAYDSPDTEGANNEFWALLTLAADPAVQIVVGETNQFPGFEGREIAGSWFLVKNELFRLDEDVLQLLSR